MKLIYDSKAINNTTVDIDKVLYININNKLSEYTTDWYIYFRLIDTEARFLYNSEKIRNEAYEQLRKDFKANDLNGLTL